MSTTTTTKGRMAEARSDSTPESTSIPARCGSAPDLATLARACVELPLPAARPCGIYFLLLRGAVVYVGASGHIVARLEDHRARGVEYDRAFWRELPEKDLPRYEGALIRALLPPLNVRAPIYRGRDNEVLAEFGIPLHPDEEIAAVTATAILHRRQAPYTVSEWTREQRAARAAARKARRA